MQPREFGRHHGPNLATMLITLPVPVALAVDATTYTT
jgi:hypothetical protein